jgi:hypothetical protein
MKQTKLLFLLIATLATTLTATAQPMEQREQSDACITSAESLQRKTESQIKVEVSETVELMSILARTAGNREYNMDMAGQYTKDTEAWFAPYKQHATVTCFQSLRNQYGISYDAVMSMAIHLDIDGGKINFLGEHSDLEKRWKDIDIEDFIKKLNTFYTETRFHDFYEQHRTFYEDGLNAYEAKVMTYFHQDWYARFYGTAPTDRFRIVIGFTIGGGNYGSCRQLPGQPREVYAICGYSIDEKTGKAFENGTDYAATLIHEFNHSFVNPLYDANIDQLGTIGEKLLKRYYRGMSNQAYRNAATVINESIVRSAVIIYMQENGFSAEQIKAEMYEQIARDFLWMPELVTALHYYSKHRNRYKSLGDYYPEIAKCLEKYLKAETERIENAL